jgi:FtsZ-binding cell division protein ZapB
MEKKLTVIETAELLGVSKEAIYNRIRRGSLLTTIENGRKLVILSDDVKKSSNKKANNSVSDAYIQLLKDEMKELKERNRALETDKDKLIQEKEKLLIKSKEEIEKIYKQRDEHIKAILTLASKGAIEHKKEEDKEIFVHEETEDTAIDIDIDTDISSSKEMIETYSDWQDLRDYLKQKGYSKKEKKAIKKRFKVKK